MSSGPKAAAPSHLAANVLHFARVLRTAGVPVATERAIVALKALTLGGLHRREDFKATLSACMIDRPEQLALFDQAFHVFWRDPELLSRIMAMPPWQREASDGAAVPQNRRLAAALFAAQDQAFEDLPDIEIDTSRSFSRQEALRKADFDSMSETEWVAAKALVAALVPRLARHASRRTRPARQGRTLDWAASIKAQARGGDFAAPRYRRARLVPSPLVILADISGSMRKYSRMLLHFAHALSMSEHRVHTFVFGTRLSPISRQLRQRDPDVAVAAVVRQVDDWSGGTRIASCLHDFNRDWSRRVLGQNATVLLISDGLEHGDASLLRAQMDRLSKSARHLIWLNPLLRYEGFEARAAGIKTMLPYVDAFLPAHNIDSLTALAEILGAGLRASRRMV